MTLTRHFQTFWIAVYHVLICRVNVILANHVTSYSELSRIMTPKHIVIVGYDDITSLDLSGPLEAFSSAYLEDSRGTRQPCYKVTIAALGAKTFRSESGLRMTATCFLSSLRHLDTLLIPGGRAMRTTAANLKLANWISRRVNGIRRVASVCTGVFGVAPTGLLNGRRVTTHWKFADELAERFPELRVDANPL